jgi:hypothetical protein
MLPGMYAENPYGEVAIGAVVKGVLSALVSLHLAVRPPNATHEQLFLPRAIKAVS